MKNRQQSSQVHEHANIPTGGRGENAASEFEVGFPFVHMNSSIFGKSSRFRASGKPRFLSMLIKLVAHVYVQPPKEAEYKDMHP